MSQRISPCPIPMAVLAYCVTAPALAGTLTTDGPDLIIKTKGGLEVHSADKDFGFKIDGRLQGDYDSFDGVYTANGRGADEFYIRRAFLTLSGYAYTDWSYIFSLDFGDSGSGSWFEASVTYSGFEWVNIKVGRFDLLPGLERATSSNWITAIERSAIYELASWSQEKNGYGIQASGTYSNLVYANVGLFRQNNNEDEDSGRGKNTFLIRSVVAPIQDNGHLLHLGGSFALRRIDNTDGNDTGAISSRLGVRGVTEDAINGLRASLADGVEDGFDHDRVWLVEAAYQFGPASIQGEYLRRDLNGRDGQADRKAAGYYLQAAYTLTGEARGYRLSSGRFDRVRPSDPHLGAWEVFYRYEDLAVEQRRLADREATIHTLGINWYANDAVRISLNYLMADTDNVVTAEERAAGRTGDGEAVSARLQYVF